MTAATAVMAAVVLLLGGAVLVLPACRNRVLAGRVAFAITGLASLLAIGAAVSVLISAVVEASVPVVAPLASVTASGCVSVLFVPVEASCTLWPATTLPLASFTVTVIVETAAPSATTLLEGLAVALELAALIVLGSPTNATVGC